LGGQRKPVDAAARMSFVGKLVAAYKKVWKVEFTNAIPKSATGKILRKELIAKIKQRLSS
jgi:4-coumarate--CoA ligase